MATTTPPPPAPPTRPEPPHDRRGRRRVLLAAVLVTVLLVAVAVAAQLLRVTDTGAGLAAAAPRLEIAGDALQLTLTEGDVEEVVVTWTTRRSPWSAADLSVETVGDAVVVGAVCPTSFLGACSTRAEVTVPRGSLDELDVAVTAGRIEVSGTGADVAATTRTGTISLTGFAGTRAQLRTETGRVEVDATAAPDELDVLVGTGDVELLLPDADYDLDASVRVGTALTSVREVEGAPHRVRVAVEVGDVDITMR